MHWVLGQKKQKRKKTVCAVVETFFHFETCECAVMIKETGTLHFQYRTINGSQCFPPSPRQLRRFSILYLIWLYWMNLILKSCVWTEQSPTGFIIHSSVNKLRDIYALHICCVSFTLRILIFFNWTLTPHAYYMSYNHLGCNTCHRYPISCWSELTFCCSLYSYSSLHCP